MPRPALFSQNANHSNIVAQLRNVILQRRNVPGGAVVLISCPECGREISDAAPSCPHCGFVSKTVAAAPTAPASVAPPVSTAPIFLIAAAIAFFLALFTPRIVAVLPILAAVILAIVAMVRKEPLKPAAIAVIVLSIGLFALSESDLSSPSSIPSSASGPNGSPALAYTVARCEQESGFMFVEGLVTNNSSDSLKNVEAVATYNDASGKMVTSEDTLIEYNPILPGQTSPFKVMATYNPAMASCSVSFKGLMGGEISSMQAQ